MFFFKDLKQKNNLIFRKIVPTLVGIFLIAGGGLGFFRTANAADLKSDDIRIKVDMKVKDQLSNFARVGKNGSIQVQVDLTLASPSQLVIGTDKIDMQSSLISNRLIKGFGVGMVPKSDPEGKYTCHETRFANVTSTASAKINVCPSVRGNVTDTTSKTVQANGTLLSRTIIINNANFTDLGVTSTSALNEFYIYPYLIFDNDNAAQASALCIAMFLGCDATYQVIVNGTTVNLAYLPGKSFYAQLYETQDQADADTTAPPACTSTQTTNCVPGYGSVTATANVSEGGSGLLGLINKVIAALLQIVTEFLYFVFYWLVAPTIQAMLSIHTYTDKFANVIYPGWEIVRNVSNIFFIVALISIAMATLFRVESYNYRHLLVQLIIAALLVNFSLVICQAILAVADTIQNQFLPNNVEVIRSLARDLMVSNIRDVIYNTNFAQFGTFSQTVSLLFYVSMSIASFSVFAAICAYLVIRIVWLWILMMVSPIAYVAGVIPSTASYKSQWWSSFLKYAFFTPIMAFFLNMAALISTNQASVLRTVTSADFADSTAPTLSAFVFKVASNILLLVFLFIALQVAEQFGIYGASAISETAKKGWFAPFKAAKWAGGRAFEGVQNTFGVTLSPKQLAEDWKHYSEEKKAERLRNRQSGLGRFNIQGRTGIPTASPHDLFETYANMKGVGRIFRSRFGLRGFKHAGKLAEAVKDKQDILTDDERALMDAEAKNLAQDKTSLQNLKDGALGPNPVTGMQGAKLQARLIAKLEGMGEYDATTGEGKTGELKELQDRIDELTKRGETASAAFQQTQFNKLKTERDNLASAVAGLDTQLATPGADVDLTPYSGFESVKETLGEQLTDLRRRRADLASGAVKDDRLRAKHNLKAYTDPTHVVFDAKAKSDAIKEYKQKEEHAQHLKRPEMFHSRAARNEAEQSEAKKIQDVDEAEELIRYLKDAIHEDNTARVGAILKKLAKDSNFNEALGAMGYEASFDGMKQFFDKELAGKLHMSENHKLQLATEVGYVNEDVNWWDLARVTSMGPKGLQWSTHDQHHSAITAEMRKRYPQRQARDFSRISYVTQKSDPVKGWVSTGIHDSGIQLLRDFGEKENLRQFQQNVRVNTAMAISSVPGWDGILRKAGVSEDVIKAIVDKSKQKDRG